MAPRDLRPRSPAGQYFCGDRVCIERQTAPGLPQATEKEKQMKHNRYPAGWNEERVQHVLQHYETQTEEEAVAEDEAALRRRDQTVMVVPKTLVPRITRLIAAEGRRKQSTALNRSAAVVRTKPERVRSGRGK